MSQQVYERSIARIFNREGRVIGTGFLVAPGYVLTCAHVVLQALGVKKEDFVNYEGIPSKRVTLEFPVSAIERKIEAEVVAWLPYCVESGDVAGLKLLQEKDILSSIKPILIQGIEYGGNKNPDTCDIYMTFGFAETSGSRSDPYQANGFSAGNRIQLCKVNALDDDTIRPGFSGAPVWIKDSGVIGMIATAQEKKSKAYGILATGLNPILKKLSAYSLCDLIEKYLFRVDRGKKEKISNAIVAAFRLCNSGSVWSDENTLGSRLLSLTRLGERGWDGVDRLTQFSIFLAVMDVVPPKMYQQIKNWVEYRGFDFDNLQTKAIMEKRECNVSPTYFAEHLVVQVRPDEQNEEKVWISMWPIGDRETYNPLEPPQYLLQDKDLTLRELPTFIENFIDNNLSLDEPMVHFFVPRNWLARDFDSCKTESDITLGSQYKLVMRTDLTQSPTLDIYYQRWKEKWEKFLEDKARSHALINFVRIDTTKKAQLLRIKRVEMAILENLSTDQQVDSVFGFIAKKTALPIALWVRKPEFYNQVDSLLDKVVIKLPERILNERCEALESEDMNSLGCYLSLVWEDPKIVPPTTAAKLYQENG